MKNDIKPCQPSADNTISYLADLKASGEILRMGTLFDTEFCNYYYDTGTGRVLRLEDETYYVLNNLFNPSTTSQDFLTACESVKKETIDELIDVTISENLFQSPLPKKMHLVTDGSLLEDEINNNLQQIILEVTEQCNFRCKYCIYNEDYEDDRGFGIEEMTFDIAQMAIDYGFSHSGSRLAVTFYGGEPLVQFGLMRKAMEYVLECKGNYPNKKISFSFTSNMTLLTQEMADFFKTIPDLSVTVSLDGPKDVHDLNRVYSGNQPTHDHTMRGLKMLSKAFEETSNTIAINTVLTPPYDYDKLRKMDDFFQGLTFLDEETMVHVTYPAIDTYDAGDYFTFRTSNPIYQFHNRFDPLMKYQESQAKAHSISAEKTRNLYFNAILNTLVTINNRMHLPEPEDKYTCNGCCLPGGRKIYIKANGDLLICEKIGNSPSLGNIHTGLNFDIVKKYYVDDYMEKSLPKCKGCWAINLCSVCYATCYKEAGLDMKKKEIECEATRMSSLKMLSIYHSFYEQKPDVFDVVVNTSTGPR